LEIKEKPACIAVDERKFDICGLKGRDRKDEESISG
jgi:hypothetical protein